MSDVEKKKVEEELRAKQLPRRCETVSYEAYIMVDGKEVGMPATAKTANGDKWLNKLFGIIE
ncbi:MAG: hypothetical protein HRT69_11760 [Flavobacteriaceae bacterium]|nr:hypothetical protein [Flavobacteriaceae bacterium]